MRKKSSKVRCRIQTIWDECLRDAEVQVSDDGLFNIFYDDSIVSTWEKYVVRVVYNYETFL